MTKVLFVCVANSGRSVMAERIFRRAASGRHQGRSAGSAPGTAAHPQVLEALNEIGIDPGKVAVERNLEIVPRSLFGEVCVEDGDEFEIVHFVGGG